MAWRFCGRLPGMTMQSHGTVMPWHGDLLSDSQVPLQIVKALIFPRSDLSQISNLLLPVS